jgi:hypothetical protein
MGLLASLPPMLMNQCWPNRGRVSSSASWKHSGIRDAVKLAARLQNTLTYYQTILGPDPIMDFDSLQAKFRYDKFGTEGGWQ